MELERIPLPLAEPCTSCGSPPGKDHDEECLLTEHEAMLAGDERAQDLHDTEDCYWCAALQSPLQSKCRCGTCCRQLLIEVTLEDARLEPRIRELGSPIYESAELTASGKKELRGYVLNSKDNDYACAFLDQATNLCTIYATRPLLCRLFDCDAEREPSE